MSLLTFLGLKSAQALPVGAPAPIVQAINQDGQPLNLGDYYRKGLVLVYFYPKADTPGCTAEACGFRDALPNFAKTGATVIGLSKDSVASHDKFKKKYKLPFMLASDEDTAVAKRYGVWIEKSMYGRKYMGMDRSTFLIDGKGVIRGLWRKVKVPGHVDEVLKAVKAL